MKYFVSFSDEMEEMRRRRQLWIWLCQPDIGEFEDTRLGAEHCLFQSAKLKVIASISNSAPEIDAISSTHASPSNEIPHNAA